MGADRPVASGALTEEQSRVISSRSGPLLVGAGAGAGKTSVLVERFVRAVQQDAIAPGRILAITFTERAAAELRQRIRDRFLELGQRDGARDLEGAFLGTFHGFCARLLRSQPLYAGVDPDFAILEEGLASRLRSIAFSGALQGFLAEGGPPALELLAAYGADRTQSMIFEIYDELRSRGQREPRLPQPAIAGSAEVLRQKLKLAAAEAGAEIDSAFAKRPGQRLQSALEALSAAGTLLAGEQQDLSPRALGPLRLPGGASGALASEPCARYRQALEDYASWCADVQGGRTLLLIDDLLDRFNHSYAELKRSRAALDFDDLELGARDLLREHQQVREHWSDRLQLLMVDEFQDSNPRQLEILSAIERENLCTVGDEFQSIYGFRHADVSLFRERRARLAPHDAVLTLARNFRGRAELLDLTNAVFENRFGPEYTPLLAGRAEPTEDAQPGPLVELLLTDKDGWPQPSQDDPRAPVFTQSAWRVAEASLLARRIAELIDAKQATASEIVILLRGLGDLDTYQTQLERLGIQTLATVGGFWKHQQVEDILCYLRALCNPLDELALYGTLASPLGGLSSDGLALLAHAARRSGVGVWETIRDIAGDLYERLSDTDRQALVSFRGCFAHERTQTRRHTIARLIARVIENNGYSEHALGLPGGERRLANIHKLMRIASSFEASEGRDLRAFLEHVAHLRDRGERSEPDAPVAEGALDAVRLMSIHAAKGLEFPVVCVADMGRSGNPRSPDLLIDAHGEGPARIGLQLVSLDGSETVASLDFKELRRERQQSESEEEQRIIYVAMTRARERLLLSGAVDFKRWPEEKPGSPSIGWIAPALIEDLPAHLQSGQATAVLPAANVDGAQVRCWLNTPENCQAQSPRSPAEHLEESLDQLPEIEVRPAKAPNRSARAQEILDRQRTFSYTSLSQLKRCGYSYYLRHILRLPEDRAAPRSFTPRAGVQGRSRGEIVHRLLESVDFARFTTPSLVDIRQAGRENEIELSDSEAQELAAFVGGLAGNELVVRLAAAGHIAKEQPFAFELTHGGSLFTGALDILARERDGGWLVVDYKTDQLQVGEDLEALVRRHYSLQRLLYGIAALRAGAGRVNVIHWFLERPDEPVDSEFVAGQLDALQDELAGLIKDVREAGFQVAEQPHYELCHSCPGRRGLCSWGEDMTLREHPEEIVQLSGQGA